MFVDGENSLDVRALAAATLTFQNNGLTRLVTTRAYDALNRLTNITSASNSVVYAAFAYGYNAANQRTNVTTAERLRMGTPGYVNHLLYGQRMARRE